jgi:hypothetical protein
VPAGFVGVQPAEERPLRVGRPAGCTTASDGSAILALVDELAVLAADLWFKGKLDNFSVDEEPPDADAE